MLVCQRLLEFCIENDMPSHEIYMWNLYRGIVLSCMVMYVRTN